MQTGRARN